MKGRALFALGAVGVIAVAAGALFDAHGWLVVVGFGLFTVADLALWERRLARALERERQTMTVNMKIQAPLSPEEIEIAVRDRSRDRQGARAMIRIRCKAPIDVPPARGCTLVPSLVDCEVFFVVDGVEHPVGADITAIKFEVRNDGEPARVTLEAFNVELEADAILLPHEPVAEVKSR